MKNNIIRRNEYNKVIIVFLNTYFKKMNLYEETYGWGEYTLTEKQFFQLSKIALARFYVLNKFTED